MAAMNPNAQGNQRKSPYTKSRDRREGTKTMNTATTRDTRDEGHQRQRPRAPETRTNGNATSTATNGSHYFTSKNEKPQPEGYCRPSADTLKRGASNGYKTHALRICEP